MYEHSPPTRREGKDDTVVEKVSGNYAYFHFLPTQRFHSTENAKSTYGFMTFESLDGVFALMTSFLSTAGTPSVLTGLERTINRVPVLYFMPPLTES
jgi:hypothetical protein